jgi:hypothetical protein
MVERERERRKKVAYQWNPPKSINGHFNLSTFALVFENMKN